MIPPEYHADEKMSTGILKKRKMKVFRRERAVPSSFLADSRRERKPMYRTTRAPARRGVLKLNSKKRQNRLPERNCRHRTRRIDRRQSRPLIRKKERGRRIFPTGAFRSKTAQKKPRSKKLRGFCLFGCGPQPADSSSARVSQMLAMSSA